MTEGTKEVLSPFSREAAPFVWLIYDVFLLLILLSGMLFYQDLDIEMKKLLRLHFVHSVSVTLVSGFHLLAYNRHLESREVLRLNEPSTPYLQFQAWKSYSFYAAKVVLAATFAYVAISGGYA